MLEERERPKASTGDSRTSYAGSAGTNSGTVGSRAGASGTGTSGTGASGARSARKKRGIFHRTGITFPAAFLAVLLVVVVWGAAKVMNPQGAGANSLFQSIDGLGTSSSVAALAKERETLIAMTAATKTLTVAAVPAHTDPDEIIAGQDSSSLDEGGGTNVTTMAVPADPTAAQATAKAMLASFGFSSGQWSCLYSLWERESTWNVYAENAASGAYGIPQSLPGDKMASAGADWQTDAATQIKWGLGYISQIYGTPCGAWDHEEADGFY
jgi:hypothetical protein